MHHFNTQSPLDRQSFGIIIDITSRLLPSNKFCIFHHLDLLLAPNTERERDKRKYEIVERRERVCVFLAQTNLKDVVMMVMIVYWMRREEVKVLFYLSILPAFSLPPSLIVLSPSLSSFSRRDKWLMTSLKNNDSSRLFPPLLLISLLHQ